MKNVPSEIDTLMLRGDAKNALLQIKTVEDGARYLNKLSAIERWVRAEKEDAELQNLIAEQKIRTQRLLGQLIALGQQNNELLKKGEKKSNSLVSVDDNRKEKKSLSDIGLSRNQSEAFQKIASIPTETFEEALRKNKADVDAAVNELTSSHFIRLANSIYSGPRTDKPDSFNKQILVDLRTEKNVSQFSLAMETGVEAATLSRLEAGETHHPSFDTVARIAEFFQVPMENFKTGSLL